MSLWFKSKGRMILVMAVLLLVVTVLAASLALATQGELSLPGFAGSSMPKAKPEPPPDPEYPGLTQISNQPESQEPESEPEPEPVIPSFHVPTYLRGVFLTPGIDYIKTGDTSESLIKQEIDQAIENVRQLTMNSIIIQTNYEGRVIYDTAGAPEYPADFDMMDYIVSRCREESLYTYAVFDASRYTTGESAGMIDSLTINVREFAEAYQLDGILLDGYTNEKSGESYKLYTLLGGAVGFDNFMRHTPEAITMSAVKAIRRAAPDTQVGLLADAVWANAGEDEAGSATQAVFTSLTDGNADTKAFVESGLFDFIAVKALSSLTSSTEPFGEVAGWWAEVAREAEVPLYVVQASSKACTEEEGWISHDQLTKQAIELDGLSGVRGAMFDSLQRMVEDPKESATTLIKYYRQEVQAEHILTELAITKPEQNTFTTAEPSVTFTGASDPNSVVTINGEVVVTDASGYFTVLWELEGGENIIVIEHKEKVLTYTITRMVEIVKEVTPQGTLKADGSMDITITALAYYDAEVFANINNTTVEMEINESVVEEADRDSNYKLFVGVYTAPPATASEQNLGAITVTGNWQGETKSLEGATVLINKKARIEDGVPVVVIADQAPTYPANTLDNIPHPSYYPLPKGAMDYAVGQEITYVNYKGITSKFYVLASGLRVDSSHIQASQDYASGNAINDLQLEVHNGYTYLILPMTQKVSYTFSYKNNGVSILFHNTIRSPSTEPLGDNPLFTGAEWSNNCTLDLELVKAGGFMGYKGYYDEQGNLVLRFNNPPPSVENARIAIDPGHGGNDPGTLGFLRDYPERTVNWAIASYLAQELESRGAAVLLINPSGNPSLENRVKQAEDFNADLFVSVHNNSASRAAAVGTEVYYFYPYSYAMANNAAANVSGQLASTNRGARQSYYNVTLSSQFQSVLVECGFMSNKDEYEKLITTKYEQRIAVGIADAVSSAIKATYTGIPGGETSGSEDDEPDAGEDEDILIEDVEINPESIELRPGESVALEAEITPDDAADQTVLWTSDDTSVATVDKNGRVTAVGEGTATIEITTVEGGHSATARVDVGDAANSGTPVSEAEEAWFEEDEYELRAGSSIRLEIDSDVGALSNSDFEFESGDTDIAAVDKNGIVTAKREGEVGIYAVSKDGELELFCDVVVTD